MSKFVERLLGLSAPELARALPLFLYLFLTIAASVASRATRDALFLDRYSALQLPYVDIAIALLVALVASFYIRLGQRINLRNLQMGSLLVFAALAAGFWWLSLLIGEEGSGPLFVTIYIWVGVFSVLAPAQVWTLANSILTTREAKRAFGFIGSGAILGWIVGGLATQETVGRFGTESMLLYVAGSLLLCMCMVALVWRDRPSYVDDDAPASRRVEGESGGLWTSLALLRESPYLRAIAVLILLSACATTVAGWQFKAVAKLHIADTDRLAEFFGTFNVIAGLASFILQVALTGRILRRAGVGVAIFIVPTALAASSLGLLVTGTLAAAAALKASDQVLRYSIDKATVELLYLPMPSSQTFRAKSFIDTVVYRMGDALGGVAILVFALLFGLNTVQMSWICLVLLAGWGVAAWLAQQQYLENLRDSIHQHRVDLERATPVIERSTAALLETALGGTQDQILFALRLLEQSRDVAMPDAVPALLRHESPKVRSRALALLARSANARVRPDVERLLYDPDLSVRTEALLYLSELSHVDPLERIEELGDFPDFSIRAGMAAFLARPGRTQNLDAARLMLNGMARESGEEGPRTRAEAARLIGILPDQFDHELRLLLQDDSSAVVREAIDAVGKLGKRTFLPRVVDRLADPQLKDVAVIALAAFGDRVVGTLRDYVSDRATPIDVRREIPAVLFLIDTPSAQAALTAGVLDRDAVVRYRAITALNKLAQAHPERSMDVTTVQTVLAAEIISHYRSQQLMGTVGPHDDAGDPVLQQIRTASGREEERIFRLLKILYPDYDLHSAYVGLQSTDPIVYDNALEFLETILAPPLRAVLVPLFDRQVTVQERKSASHLRGPSSVNRMEILRTMILSDNPWLQSSAAYVIGELALVQFASALDTWASVEDPLLQTTARDARDKLRRALAPGAGAELR